MEPPDSDTADSSGKSSRLVSFRPSRSRERRQTKNSSSFLEPRHNPLHTRPLINAESIEMTKTSLPPSVKISYKQSETKLKERKLTSSPIPYKFEYISSEPVDDSGQHSSRKPSQTFSNRDQSSRKRSGSATTTTNTPIETPSLELEKFSSTLSVQREKSELSQIISAIFQPRPRGIKGAFISFRKWVYNDEDKTFFGRTCKSWILIIIYGIIYLIFQMAFTLFWLYISLLIINSQDNWPDVEKTELQTYGRNGIGLSAVPATEGNLPLIWFRSKDPKDYNCYVEAIDSLFQRRTRNATELKSLGPCGQSPYGYGERPCILVRINKQIGWSARALLPNSSLTSSAPTDVQKWILAKTMLWLHCAGYNQYDREHIQKIQYFPDPPGISPDIFPLNMNKDSPLIGVQFTEFTKGISIAVQCKLWYDTGTSAVEFVIFVTEGSFGLSKTYGRVC